MKKLFPDNKVSKKGFVEFLDKKGFFIVLVLCVAIVGATAVFVTTNNISSSNTDFDTEKIIPEEVSVNALSKDTAKAAVQSSVSSNSNAGTTGTKAVNAPAEGVKAAAQNGTVAIHDAEASVPTTAKATEAKSQTPAKAQTQAFAVPVFGNVSFEYAMDKLVFSKTLDEWTVHSGIDIAAERGSQVKAVADGVVSEIKNDPRLGIMVIIDHQNGIKTVYANLAGDDMLTPNQKVKAGDVVGSIGNTATFESAEQPHLHFEVLKNNVPVNPAEYLPKNN